ncbi:MAG TPA: polysaccharide biosynthesis/export family protein [Bryobacteraceae bacterium]|nr:polysaccharide biosynthesis/export family protein [Bryobacteraceae bacterium]
MNLAIRLTPILCLTFFAHELLAQAPVPPPVAPERKESAPPPSGGGLGPATRSPKAETDEAQQKAAALPAMVTAAPVDPKTYEIGPEDVLLIRVWREPEFSGPVQVRPDGKFTLPLVGDIPAAGLTPNKLAEDITKALTEFINKPEVTVSLQSVQSKKYYITGEVNRTGSFPLIVPTTVLEALTNAGGFREFARSNKIVIMRGLQRIKFNYKEVIKGKNLEQNILVQNGDYIHVP